MIIVIRFMCRQTQLTIVPLLPVESETRTYHGRRRALSSHRRRHSATASRAKIRDLRALARGQISLCEGRHQSSLPNLVGNPFYRTSLEIIIAKPHGKSLLLDLMRDHYHQILLEIIIAKPIGNPHCRTSLEIMTAKPHWKSSFPNRIN